MNIAQHPNLRIVENKNKIYRLEESLSDIESSLRNLKNIIGDLQERVKYVEEQLNIEYEEDIVLPSKEVSEIVKESIKTDNNKKKVSNDGRG